MAEGRRRGRLRGGATRKKKPARSLARACCRMPRGRGSGGYFSSLTARAMRSIAVRSCASDVA